MFKKSSAEKIFNFQKQLKFPFLIYVDFEVIIIFFLNLLFDIDNGEDNKSYTDKCIMIVAMDVKLLVVMIINLVNQCRIIEIEKQFTHLLTNKQKKCLKRFIIVKKL